MVTSLSRVLVAGFLLATASAAACSSFGDGVTPNDTATSDAGSDTSTDATTGSDAASSDASGDAGAPYCADRMSFVSADFANGKVVQGFEEESSDGGTLQWNGTEGATAKGSLEAITSGGEVQAQIARDFDAKGAVRARLTFAARVKSIAESGSTRIGCTLQLASPDVDGGDVWAELLFVGANGAIRFDEDSYPSGAGLPSVAIDDLNDQWKRYSLELIAITETTITLRASLGDKQIAPMTAVLQGPPDRFRIKCGIDESHVGADVLTDDITFESCAAP